MIKPIPTTQDELDELLTMWSKRGIYTDAETARGIYDNYVKRRRIAESPVFTFNTALGVIYRIGYTIGQRHERARKAENKKARNNNVQR